VEGTQEEAPDLSPVEVTPRDVQATLLPLDSDDKPRKDKRG